MPAADPVAYALSLPDPAAKLRHLRRNSIFVYVNQVFGRDRANGLKVGFALLAVGFGVALGGVE